jgi:hypothetical protein
MFNYLPVQQNNNKLIPNALFTKFLGLTADSMLSWRIHVDHLKTKFSTTCCVIIYVKPLMSDFIPFFIQLCELWNNNVREFMSQYIHFLNAKESN